MNRWWAKQATSDAEDARRTTARSTSGSRSRCTDPTGIGSLKLAPEMGGRLRRAPERHRKSTRNPRRRIPAWNSVATGRRVTGTRTPRRPSSTIAREPTAGWWPAPTCSPSRVSTSSTGSSDVLFVPELVPASSRTPPTSVEGYFVDPDPGSGERRAGDDGIVEDTQVQPRPRLLYEAPIEARHHDQRGGRGDPLHDGRDAAQRDCGDTVYSGPVTGSAGRRCCGRSDTSRGSARRSVDTQTYIFAADVHGADMVDGPKAVPTISLRNHP